MKGGNCIANCFKSLRARIRRATYKLADMTFVRFCIALVHKIGKDDISIMASSISYFAFLSLFPLLLGLLAIFSLFLPPDTIRNELITFFGQYLPGSLGILQGSVDDITRFRGVFGLIGVVGLFWSGTGVFSAVTHAINKAWGIPYQHPFYIKKPRELGMVAGIGFLFLLSLGTSTFLTRLGQVQLPITGILVNFLTILLAFFFSLVVFMLVHKLSPVIWLSWKYVWPGAVLSTILFEIAKTIFVFYLNSSSHYDAVYGSIASVIISLVWIYYSAFILLLGAEFSALLFKMKREGETFDQPSQNNILIKDL